MVWNLHTPLAWIFMYCSYKSFVPNTKFTLQGHKVCSLVFHDLYTVSKNVSHESFGSTISSQHSSWNESPWISIKFGLTLTLSHNISKMYCQTCFSKNFLPLYYFSGNIQDGTWWVVWWCTAYSVLLHNMLHLVIQPTAQSGTATMYNSICGKQCNDCVMNMIALY